MYHKVFYYMEESVLLGTKPLVDSIRHFIRDPSGIFSVSPLWVSYRSMTSRFHSNDITIPEDSRRYEFYVLVARTISHSFVSLTHEILFLPLKHKIYIFSPPCNILYLLHRFLNLCFKLEISISAEVIVTSSISLVIPIEGPSFQCIDSLVSLVKNHLSVCLNSKSATERKFNTEALTPPTAFHKWHIFFISHILAVTSQLFGPNIKE